MLTNQVITTSHSINEEYISPALTRWVLYSCAAIISLSVNLDIYAKFMQSWVCVALPSYSYLELVVFQVFMTNTVTNFDQSSLQLAPCMLIWHFHLECTHQVRISVTTVRGTMGINPEVAAPFSSGGFSCLFDHPFIQDSAVGTYLKELGKAYKGLFNPNGHAYPDVLKPRTSSSHWRVK